VRGFLEPCLNPNVMRETHHWVLANENLVPALAAKHDHYPFSRNAGHVDHATKLQTLPEALKYVWEDYHSPTRYRIFGNDVDQKPLR